jgi:hypothetical protein
MIARRFWSRFALATALMTSVSTAFAQTPQRVIVVTENATIWQSPTGPMLTVVEGGTTWEVVRPQPGGFEIVVPAGGGKPRTTGFLASSSAQALVPGQPRPAVKRAPPAPRMPGTGLAGPVPAIRGFAELGHGTFTASQTFDAVLGQSTGTWFGGGGQVRLFRHYFAQVAIEHFSRDGERVFVNNGTVFKLGIPDAVKITPVTVTGGYLMNWKPSIRPYLGLGVGHYAFSETSTAGSEEDTVKVSANGYQALFGVEWRALRSTSAAFELQYAWVPDAFDAGTALAFGEDDLGGVQLRVKILFGK